MTTPTKLKNMRLTSVDLVKAGANQEANIRIHKGLDVPPEDPPARTIAKSDPDRFDVLHEIEKFNPFHDELGRFASKNGFKTYSANPKMRAAQPSIIRSAQAGHGRTLNVHRESKGENVGQNYDWMQGKPTGKPAAPPPKPKQPPQPKKTPPKQDPKDDPSKNDGVSSGKATNAVDGKDLTGKFAFDDSSSDYTIEQVIKAQGFDALPTITKDPEAFAKACSESNFIAKRGVGASDQRTMDGYDDALKNGEFYVKCKGGSVHGYGMYAASVAANGKNASQGLRDAEGTAQAYAGGGGAKKIYTFTLDKSAKIGNEYELADQMKNDTEYQKMCRNSKISSYYTKDIGVYAAYKGYDAYIGNNGRGENGRYSDDGSSSDYTVVLNRSKVILFEAD